ncbi:MAG: AAA family ATPase [Bacilli bacterium]
MGKYSFIHPETGKEISFETDKKNIIIYGKNGSGKTTLTRSKNFDKKYVFNEDFVNKNVYVVGIDGAKTDTDTKSGFSSLWIGEDIVKIKKEIEHHAKLKSECLENKKVITKQIDENIIFSGVVISQNIQIKLQSYEDSSFVFNSTKPYSLAKSEHNCIHTFISKITSKEELKEKIDVVKNNISIKDLINILNKNTFLKSIFNDKIKKEIDNLNLRIENLKEKKNSVEQIKKFLISKDIDYKLLEKMNPIIEIQKKYKKCVICNNENISDKITEWDNILKNTYIAEQQKLKNEFDSISIFIERSVFLNKERYTIVAPKIIEELEELNNIFKRQSIDISNNNYEKINYELVDFDNLFMEVKDLIDDIENYVIINMKQELLFDIIYNKKIDKIIEAFNDNLMKSLGLNAKKYEEEINKVLEELGLSKALELKTDKRSTNDCKYDFKIVGHSKINELSDGQKHKLALAIFLSNILKENFNNKIIVIDDPVVAMDAGTYHYFKKFVLQKLAVKRDEDGKTGKIILLTHNIHYLYVQISNLIENEEARKDTIIYKLSKIGIEEVPLSILNMDDLVLFKTAITTISNISEIMLVRCLIIKIFRCLIDLKLRFKGIISAGNPASEIAKLDLDKKKSNDLSVINKTINSLMKKKITTVSEVYQCLELLKNSSNILGYDELIVDEELNNIKDIIDNDIKGDPASPVFDILQKVEKILFCSKPQYNYFVNYIEHPRNWFTKNLTALDLDDDMDIEEKKSKETEGDTIHIDKLQDS